MKKVSLLLALALSSTMVFAGCGYTNQTETATNDEGHDIVGTTWVLTNVEHGKPPVEPPSETSSEERAKSPELPSGEEIAELMGVSLEFKEDDKVSMTSNFASKEFTYSHIHNQEDEPCISVTGDKNNTLTAVVEDDIMTFSTIGGGLMIFEKQ